MKKYRYTYTVLRYVHDILLVSSSMLGSHFMRQAPTLRVLCVELHISALELYFLALMVIILDL